jgi:predicted PurR-regulated permease PerM
MDQGFLQKRPATITPPNHSPEMNLLQPTIKRALEYDSVGIILTAITTLIAFVLAMLSRFSSKDHPRANRFFVILSVVNGIVGIGSVVSASRSVTQQNKILSDLNEAQKKLLMKAEDQLRIGDEFAGKLTTAQRTTERISSELTNNTWHGIVLALSIARSPKGVLTAFPPASASSFPPAG